MHKQEPHMYARTFINALSLTEKLTHTHKQMHAHTYTRAYMYTHTYAGGNTYAYTRQACVISNTTYTVAEVDTSIKAAAATDTAFQQVHICRMQSR